MNSRINSHSDACVSLRVCCSRLQTLQCDARGRVSVLGSREARANEPKKEPTAWRFDSAVGRAQIEFPPCGYKELVRMRVHILVYAISFPAMWRRVFRWRAHIGTQRDLGFDIAPDLHDTIYMYNPRFPQSNFNKSALVVTRRSAHSSNSAANRRVADQRRNSICMPMWTHTNTRTHRIQHVTVNYMRM